MKTKGRVLVGVLGLLLLGLGLGSLNYTAPGKREHHATWAEEKGFPAPSQGIFLGGVGALAAGTIAVAVGLLAGGGARSGRGSSTERAPGNDAGSGVPGGGGQDPNVTGS